MTTPRPAPRPFLRSLPAAGLLLALAPAVAALPALEEAPRALAFSPGILTAQEAPLPGAGGADDRETRTLTLQEALELARTHNPEYRRVRNELDLNHTARRTALSAFLPSLNTNMSTGAGFSQITRTEDLFGRPIELDPDEMEEQLARNYTSNAGQSFSLSWSIQGLDPWYGLEESRAGNRARELRAETRRHVLEMDVRQGFFDAQEQEEMLALEEAMLEGRERDLEASERLYALARQDRTDVLGAELEVFRQRGSIEDARGELRKELLDLASLVGAPDLDDFRIQPEPVRIFDPSGLDVDRLVETALAASPALLEQEAALDEQRASARSARVSRFSPTIGFSATLSRSAFAADQLALFDMNPRDQRAGSIGFSLSLPIDDLFVSRAHEEQQAQVALRNQTETLREERLTMRRDVASRVMDLETAFRRLEIEERSREIADERLRLTQEGWRMARRSFDELQTAVREAANARRDVISARYDFHRARLELERTVGVPIEVPEGEEWDPRDGTGL